jgi:hypothetical protein
MIQRILDARHFLARLLSAATGMALYFRTPFPEDNIFLRVMAIRSESAFLFLKYSYTLFLYTTPYLVYSILLSGVYIFALKTGRRIRAGKLPLYSDPRKRTELSLVVGEVHHPRKQVPSETPRWLVIPERGLFTGIAIVGAVGSGKTASCMYPFAEQILAYRAQDPDRRIGGLILEVKGDFCGKAQEILARPDGQSHAVYTARRTAATRLPSGSREKTFSSLGVPDPGKLRCSMYSGSSSCPMNVSSSSKTRLKFTWPRTTWSDSKRGSPRTVCPPSPSGTSSKPPFATGLTGSSLAKYVEERPSISCSSSTQGIPGVFQPYTPLLQDRALLGSPVACCRAA